MHFHIAFVKKQLYPTNGKKEPTAKAKTAFHLSVHNVFPLHNTFLYHSRKLTLFQTYLLLFIAPVCEVAFLKKHGAFLKPV